MKIVSKFNGNILENKSNAIVNAVNCVGVMGAGLAHQFKQKFPDNYVHYRQACQKNEVKPGKMFVYLTRSEQPKYIINFPTKNHWKNPSKLEYIDKGLNDLVTVIKNLQIQSIAIPPLGCGLGGLDWKTVRSLIIEKLKNLDILVVLYEQGSGENTESHNTNKQGKTIGTKIIEATMKNINTEIFEKLFEAVDNAKSKKDIKDILVEVFTHQYKTLKPRNKLSPFAPELNKTKIFSKIKQTALELAPSEESLLYVFDLFKRADGTTAFKGRIIDKRLLLARQMSGEHYAFDIDANKFFKIEPLSRENN